MSVCLPVPRNGLINWFGSKDFPDRVIVRTDLIQHQKMSEISSIPYCHDSIWDLLENIRCIRRTGDNVSLLGNY